MAYFRAFSRVDWSRSALAELRGAAGGFEAVLLALLHPGVAGQETDIDASDTGFPIWADGSTKTVESFKTPEAIPVICRGAFCPDINRAREDAPEP